MSDLYYITHPDCAEPLLADKAQLVCIQPTNNGDLSEDIDLAMQNPSRVSEVSAYPEVVEACERQQKIIKAQMALLVAYRTGGRTPEVALRVLETRTAVEEATCAALSHVHPAAEGDTT